MLRATAARARAASPARCAPGTTSSSTSTTSMPAGGGCDSRSSRISVRSTRASRIGAGRCSVRSCVARVTSRSRVVTSTAPRSARSSDADSASHSRASTNDSGSSPSIGHSSSSRSRNAGARRPARAARHPRRTRPDASARRSARAARARRRAAAARDRPACAGPSGRRMASRSGTRRSGIEATGLARVSRASAWRLRAAAADGRCRTRVRASEAARRRAPRRSSGRATTVTPGRACASSHAAVVVRGERDAHVDARPRAPARCTSRAMSSGAPITRASPLASKTTARSPCTSTRGEHARATASSARQQASRRSDETAEQTTCMQGS